MRLADDGLDRAATAADNELYHQIRKAILERFQGAGHGYTPLKGQFRASSVPYCKRKILLSKDPLHYLDEHDLVLLPIAVQSWIKGEEEAVPSTFGSAYPGQMIHEMIQEALKGQYVGIEEEIKVNLGEFEIVGHYDILMEDQDGNRVVIDIKTTSTKREYLPNHSHTQQLMTYQGILGGIRGALFYINRNNFECSYIPQAFDKDQYSLLVAKIAELASYESRNELPPPVPSYPAECGNEYYNCDFYNYCFPERVTDKEQHQESGL